MSALRVLIASLLTLSACDADKQDTEPIDVGDTDLDTDPDPDTDSDPPTAPLREGLLQRVGSANVGAVYTGTEDLQLVGDDGVIECRIRYALVSVAIRDDCPGCEWAFDLAIQDAALVEDPNGACLGTTGFDATNVGDLDGTITSRGYDPEFAGHAEVMLAELAPGAWDVVTYVVFEAGVLGRRLCGVLAC